MKGLPSRPPAISRRIFLLGSSITGIVGGAALYSLLRTNRPVPPAGPPPVPPTSPPPVEPAGSPPEDAAQPPSVTPAARCRAERVIFLFMSGGPSQVDLFDPKPELAKRHGQELPDSFRKGLRLAQTLEQKSLPLLASTFRFRRCGRQAGAEFCDLLPYLAGVADDIAIVKSMYTDAVNHDPAVTFLFTGSQLAGRPTSGAWVAYGLGSLNNNLPSYLVLMSGDGGQALAGRYWNNGFLPGNFQGIPLRPGGEPVLYLSCPPGIDPSSRRKQLDALRRLNELKRDLCQDPEITTRIQAYEMGFRMQTSVPGLMDLSGEPPEVLELYGAKPGAASFANNCLLARRLAESGVRFVQLIHRDWDHHTGLVNGVTGQCGLVDRPAAALITDLKRRGMLDSTLVVWAGEFGRTPFCQGSLSDPNYGRDHHARCFSIWMAGGGIRPGISYGKTDDLGCEVVESPVHVHDLNATILHCLGIDHKRLTFRHQGRDFRLTDTSGEVVRDLLL
jgi:hypothetical protein